MPEPTKKTTAKPPMTKTDFVRTQCNVPAKDVVARAAKQGLKLTEKYVYVIRSQAKAKAAGKSRTTRVTFLGVANSGTDESTLRRAIAELGLTRARQVLDEVESTFGGTK